ncbi:uncharacterized protein MYCFIDRAFT_177400 [Pseudocercospora fijiensis CIRAD86]|uniref:Uncharacterized protein n=1 Tax=Pseudocercospora fijiensis (strain CIRAD86) TaxID=383855 RepID=M2ZMW9_PSEFD|nr:uncharacterized protein MYCFIDRAFT_177400 [Pseudocercospora fijiensis CIRAD86]EME80459.1 hypothetical protein MYCFIDRAFT_177400 [Pseudocercospora fijiensis CIRAD86]
MSLPSSRPELSQAARVGVVSRGFHRVCRRRGDGKILRPQPAPPATADPDVLARPTSLATSKQGCQSVELASPSIASYNNESVDIFISIPPNEYSKGIHAAPINDSDMRGISGKRMPRTIRGAEPPESGPDSDRVSRPVGMSTSCSEPFFASTLILRHQPTHDYDTIRPSDINPISASYNHPDHTAALHLTARLPDHLLHQRLRSFQSCAS